MGNIMSRYKDLGRAVSREGYDRDGLAADMRKLFQTEREETIASFWSCLIPEERASLYRAAAVLDQKSFISRMEIIQHNESVRKYRRLQRAIRDFEQEEIRANELAEEVKETRTVLASVRAELSSSGVAVHNLRSRVAELEAEIEAGKTRYNNLDAVSEALSDDYDEELRYWQAKVARLLDDRERWEMSIPAGKLLVSVRDHKLATERFVLVDVSGIVCGEATQTIEAIKRAKAWYEETYGSKPSNTYTFVVQIDATV